MSMTQELVRKLFVYNPDTGDLTRRIDKASTKKGDKCGCLVGKGYKIGKGYLATRVNGKLQPNHRIIFLYVHGYLPEQVDHINNVSTDNSIRNLRACTNEENSINKPLRKNNKSGYKGVYWAKNIRAWRTEVAFKGKSYYLGSFDDKEVAAQVVRIKRIELHGEFANHG